MLQFIRKRLLLQTFPQIRRTFTKKFSSNKSWKRFEISFSKNYTQIFQKAVQNSGSIQGFCLMSLCWQSALGNALNKSCSALNSLQKSPWEHLCISFQSGARRLEGFPSSKYYNVQKWESRFTLRLDVAKNTHYIRKRFKYELFRINAYFLAVFSLKLNLLFRFSTI